jgi:hypothetical protein
MHRPAHFRLTSGSSRPRLARPSRIRVGRRVAMPRPDALCRANTGGIVRLQLKLYVVEITREPEE